MQKILLLFCLVALYSSGQAQRSTKNKPSASKIIKKGEQGEKRKNKKLQKASLSQPPVLLSDSSTEKNNLKNKLKPAHS